MDTNSEYLPGDQCPEKRHYDRDSCQSDEQEPIAKHVTHVLENIDNIIDRIFKHLPMKSLNTVMRVCHKWHTLASHVKKCRNQVSWVFCEQYDPDNLVKTVREPIQNLSSCPETAILFVSSSLHESKVAIPKGDKHDGHRPRLPKMERLDIEDYIHRVLPPSCKLFGSVTDSIVGTTTNRLPCTEVEDDKCIAGLLLPALQGISVHTFMFTETELDILQAAKGDLHVATAMPQDHEAVLTLLFYLEPSLSLTHLDPARLLTEHKTSRVVAGAAVDNYLSFRPNRAWDEMNEVAGVIFSAPRGSPDIKVAAIYLDEKINSKKKVEDKLKELKRCHVPEKNSVGFIFACCSRGEPFFGQRDVESSVFRALFPKTPLLGLFGNGEICHDYLPDYAVEGSVAEWDAKVKDEVHHSFCTSIVIISLGEQGGCKVV